ncbi:TetR/AcrR family transcriptional regulator [Paenibacillus sp. MMS20-IR301]|uniref:TetR/AcrR family transcriptional regulator n=1 Tax=Paenibacillus sp. MMS20-IR301 TaxID=2895946 RepID=UPI0028F16089|nr:TetR/AcrR family transcriptional regulator [Paenibacillus sp. MMS20-IR301]WNS46347.1 TetR/AcrR family transcriptional regulator [Paenibacillus sp. MMS20-IR301]
MKNSERREHTIRQLLDATKELLRHKSCDAVTLKDIMEQSQLSKGAIFHYVKSKDEIFARVLEERLEAVNEHFEEAVASSPDKTFEGPMQAISRSLAGLEDSHEATNKILLYMLGKENEPVVAKVLEHFHERSVSVSRQWIITGQKYGVINENVNPDETAELFVLLSLGLRVQASLRTSTESLSAKRVSDFMAGILKN